MRKRLSILGYMSKSKRYVKPSYRIKKGWHSKGYYKNGSLHTMKRKRYFVK